jgi:hypothetical protein
MPNLDWFKALIAPAAKAHTSRKITAAAVVAGAISVLRFVPPSDGASEALRWVGSMAGTLGFFWLVWLLFFPPGGSRPSGRR